MRTILSCSITAWLVALSCGQIFAAENTGPVRVVAKLTKPSLEVCLNAADGAAAKKCFVEGLSLSERTLPNATEQKSKP